MPKRKLLRPSKLAVPCPFCEGTLKIGTIELEDTTFTTFAPFANLLPLIRTDQVVVFRTPGQDREILDSDSNIESLLCDSCGTLVVPGKTVQLPRKPID